MEKESRAVVMNQDYENLKLYISQLERARDDLMGVNEVLREKINALEYGQMTLQEELKVLLACEEFNEWKLRLSSINPQTKKFRPLT